MPTSLVVTAGAWVWGKYGKSITDKLTEKAKAEWDKFGWSEAADLVVVHGSRRLRPGVAGAAGPGVAA